MTKPNECKGCLLYERQPVCSHYTDDVVEVLFIFQSPNNDAMKHGEGLYGSTGDYLKSSMKRIGLKSYGITDALRCVLGGGAIQTGVDKTLPPGCYKFLETEIDEHKPKLLVTLGTGTLRFFTGRPCYMYERPGESYLAEKFHNVRFIPMLHPSNPEFKRKWLREWEEAFDRLQEALDGIPI